LVAAKSQAGVVLRMPEAKMTLNSQTMSLLESHININPMSIGGPVVAIVDGIALASAGEESGAFVDLGHSGTGQISTYTVRSGDTLSSIAEMFGVTANTILWANDLKTRTLRVGQELVILPISGVRHIVKSGDTVASIAKKYSASQADILSYNGLSVDAKLAVGDEIIIPDGEKTSSSGSSSATIKVASGLQEYAGYYLRPIVGGKKSQGLHGHNAVDLASPIGTPIMAAADGTVTVSLTGGYNGGYGTYVVVSHPNGTQTVYGHMSANYVRVGQSVKQGEMVGRIGMTGNTSGPHVHFEIRGAKNPF
jgi:murein DD-endopeptidase MepM/ murein hydrolase activator NlpD